MAISAGHGFDRYDAHRVSLGARKLAPCITQGWDITSPADVVLRGDASRGIWALSRGSTPHTSRCWPFARSARRVRREAFAPSSSRTTRSSLSRSRSALLASSCHGAANALRSRSGRSDRSRPWRGASLFRIHLRSQPGSVRRDESYARCGSSESSSVAALSSDQVRGGISRGMGPKPCASLT